MSALTILELNPQKIPQFGVTRRNDSTPSGVVAVHTAENTADTVGIDTGAEAVAKFILERADYGSYHDLADSDSILRLVPYISEAWGAKAVNNHAYHVSGAVRADDWLTYPEDRRETLVKNMALAASWYAEWLEENYGIIIPAKRLSAAEALAKTPGFVAHGDLDPANRHDPGKDFFWSIFLTEFAALRGLSDVEPTEPVVEPTEPVVEPTEPVVEPVEPTTPESYLPLKADGDQGERTNIELYRALTTSGHYSGLVKGQFDSEGWKAYQRFLTEVEAYSGAIDGDFGKASTKAEQIFLTAVKAYTKGIDEDRGQFTIQGLQLALNQGHIKKDHVKVEVSYQQGDGWVNPVIGRLTSRFGPRSGGYHQGDDIAPPIPGTTGIMVAAAYSGIVIGAGYGNVLKGHTGNGVLIEHAGGYKTYYGHLARISVRVGQKLKTGDFVGEMGNTGNSFGVHLHFGVLSKWTFISPYSFLKARGAILGSSPTVPSQGGIIVKIKTGSGGGGNTGGVNDYDKQVQQILKDLGYYSGAIDGINGDMQKTAVRSYQKNQKYFPGLVIDDIWGAKTYAHYNWVRKLQEIMNGWRGTKITVDGDFGVRSAARVLDIQKNNLGHGYNGALDGIPGPMFCVMVNIQKHPNL